jgi:hypothetical protein
LTANDEESVGCNRGEVGVSCTGDHRFWGGEWNRFFWKPMTSLEIEEANIVENTELVWVLRVGLVAHSPKDDQVIIPCNTVSRILKDESNNVQASAL